MTGFVHSSHRTKLSFDLNDAHGNSWNRFFLSFSSRAGIEFQGQQSSSSSASALYSFAQLGKALVGAPAALPPLSRTRGKKKKNVADDQRDGQSSLGQRSRATSNVRSRFLFHSFLSPIPHTFAPRLLFLSPFPLLSSRTRAHLVKSRGFGYTDIRPNNTDSTTTAQSKIGPM